MRIILVDKELFPLELLDIGPCLLEVAGENCRVEKLPEAEDVKE